MPCHRYRDPSGVDLPTFADSALQFGFLSPDVCVTEGRRVSWRWNVDDDVSEPGSETGYVTATK